MFNDLFEVKLTKITFRKKALYLLSFSFLIFSQIHSDDEISSLFLQEIFLHTYSPT
jgi:hypothetical protein